MVNGVTKQSTNSTAARTTKFLTGRLVNRYSSAKTKGARSAGTTVVPKAMPKVNGVPGPG